MTKEQSGVMFKSAVGGYNKDDVNNYIMSENHRFSEVEENLKRQLAEQTARAFDAEQKLASAESSIRDLQSANDSLLEFKQNHSESEAALEQMRTKLSDNETLLKSQSKTIASLAAENGDLKNKISDLTAELEKAHSESEMPAEVVSYDSDNEIPIDDTQPETEPACDITQAPITPVLSADVYESESLDKEALEKSRMYEKISAQIGDIMIRAEENAADIVSAAKVNAEKIENDAKNEADIIREKASAAAAKMLSDISENVGKQSDYCKSDISAHFDGINSSVRSCRDSIQSIISSCLNNFDSEYLGTSSESNSNTAGGVSDD